MNGDSRRFRGTGTRADINTGWRGDRLNRNSHEKEFDVLIEHELTMTRRCEPGKPRPSYPALKETPRPGRGGERPSGPPALARRVLERLARCRSAAAKRVLTKRIRSGERDPESGRGQVKTPGCLAQREDPPWGVRGGRREANGCSPRSRSEGGP